MKTVLVNAVSIKEGGGAIVLSRFVNELCVLSPFIRWVVVIDEMLREQISSVDNLVLISFPWVKKTPFHLLYWYEITLPKLIRQYQVDLLFSQTNLLSFCRLPCPSLLLIQHAGFFSTLFSNLYLKFDQRKITYWIWKWHCHWVASSVKRADKITVQTQALAQAILEKTKIHRDKIVVIPHGPGLGTGEIQLKIFPEKNKVWRLGYITKFGVQKNFATLFKALQTLHRQDIFCQLILTLDTTHPPYRKIHTLIEHYGIENAIENHGEASHAKISELYRGLDIFVFPSLCESFGFTLVEAIYYGLPILSANTPSNREILGERGEFFDPYNGDHLARKLMQIMKNENEYQRLVEHSVARRQCYSWKKAASQIWETICVTL